MMIKRGKKVNQKKKKYALPSRFFDSLIVGIGLRLGKYRIRNTSLVRWRRNMSRGLWFFVSIIHCIALMVALFCEPAKE